MPEALSGSPAANTAAQAATPGMRRRRASSTAARYQEGIWAVILALVPAFPLAALLAVPTPLEPITELIVSVTPVPIANVLIRALGNLAPAAALLGALACALPAGGLLALLAPPPPDPTDPPPGDGAGVDSHALFHWSLVAVSALLVVLPLAAASAYPGETLAAILAGALYAPALALVRRIRRRFRAGATPATANAQPVASRRAFLRGAVVNGALAAGIFALSGFDHWSSALGDLLGRGEVLRRLFAFVPPRPRAAGFPVPGEEPEVTSASRFYVLSKNAFDPVIAATDWSLRVDGAVAHPFTLSFAELVTRPRVDQFTTLRCVSNPVDGHLMSTAYWSGLPIAAVLARAGLAANATAAMLRARDGYDEVLPLDALTYPGALLAYGMNGETLARHHGGPVRALVPGYFGFKNVKWVEGITLLTAPLPGYWERRGWTAGRVHSVARIDVVRPQAGGVLVAGVAFTGTDGVSRVRVRADNGDWRDAALNIPALSAMTWAQWQAVIPLPRGAHTLTARVFDGAGRPQDATPSPIQPGGATGLHTIQVMI